MSNWESSDGGGSNAGSGETLRDRYVERTLEKILRATKAPPLRVADLVIIVLLLAVLGASFFGRDRGLQGHVDELTRQVADLKQQLAKPHPAAPAQAPVVQHEAPVVRSTPAPEVSQTPAPQATMAAPRPTPETVATERVHILEPGESLWSICDKYYGDSKLVPSLAKYNGIPDVSKMKVGMPIKIPPVGRLKG